MDETTLRKLFPNASKSTLARNRDHGVGAVVSTGPEQPPIQTLECKKQKQPCSEGGVGYRITLVTFRRRLLDGHDNLQFSTKPLVDAISKTLCLDDASPRLTWEFHQLKSSSQSGVLVKIEVDKSS